MRSLSCVANFVLFSLLVFLQSSEYYSCFASTIPNTENSIRGCVEEERLALLEFKASFANASNGQYLSSWTGNNCCQWEGVGCKNITGSVRVSELNLRNHVFPDSFGYIVDVPNRLKAREVGSSLLKLRYLEELDLSYNDFSGSLIPSFLGSMPRLQNLNLSNARFNGLVPYQLGNLSRLLVLDLSSGPSEYDYQLFVESPDWLSGLASLQRLDLSWVNLRNASHGLAKVLNQLPSLTHLRLSSCGLLGHVEILFGDYINSTLLQHFDLSVNSIRGEIPDVILNMNALRVLDLSANLFNSSIPPLLGFRLQNLVRLNLGFNYLVGRVPDSFSNLTSLEFLDLSFNALEGNIPMSLWNLCSLRVLDFTMNRLNGALEPLEQLDNTTSFSRCNSSLEKLSLRWNKFASPLPVWFGQNSMNLKVLDLGNNSFYGLIPSSFGNLSKLEVLDLSHNRLNGTVPETLGKLLLLRALILSSNSLQGVMSETHFANLSRLKEIDISVNPLAFQVDSKWLPPFQLVYFSSKSCNIGPQFPGWLRTQKEITTLYLSNTSISDALPQWFPTLKFQFLDISFNQITGQLPTFSTPNSLYMNLYLSNNRFEGLLPTFPFNLNRLDLTNNFVSGPLPPHIGNMTPTLDNLLLSGNQISGYIPESLCKISTLRVLDLSKNRLSGEIPDCWSKFKILVVVDLSDNKNLSGVIPSSFGNASELKSLHLSNNSLRGEIPVSLRNCSNLVILDLGDNGLSGTLPKWIGESLFNIEILRLSSNMLNGNIPLEMCRLSQLQVLDLSHNNISGAIPSCFGNLKGMTTGDGTGSEIGMYRWSTTFGENMVQFMKGKELEYTKTLRLLINMDISRNQLTGTIPSEITKLIALRGLNLSDNHLEGNIPAMIGNINLLESLDLSENKLSGTIPESMSFLNYLSHLNLSYNDLSGKIPTGNQLQTLDDPSIYSGNSQLCGAPLSDCASVVPEPPKFEGQDDDDDDDALDKFYIFLSAGYVTGLWGVLIIMMFKKNWREAYLKFVDNLKERTSTAIKSKFKRENRSNTNQVDEWRW
ncbi:hypothetical protein UlMin_041982 [Ulmus minor]